MAVYAPKGPKKATIRSCVSGILHRFLMLFTLSTPKVIKDMLFRKIKRIIEVERGIKFMYLHINLVV